MSRREYLDACLEQPLDWLKECADSPSPQMNWKHVLLVRLAIRRKSWSRR